MPTFNQESFLANKAFLRDALLRQVRSIKRELRNRQIVPTWRGNSSWRFEHVLPSWRGNGYVEVTAYPSGYLAWGDPPCDDLVVRLLRPSHFEPQNPYGWQALTKYDNLERLEELVIELIFNKRLDMVALTYPGKWLRLIHDGLQFTAWPDPVANK